MLVAAAGVRLVGLAYGLPVPYARPDETYPCVADALQFYYHPLTPIGVAYPSVCKYLCFFIYLVTFGVGKVLGIYHSYEDLAVQYYLDPTVVLLLARMIGVIMGTASVYLVYRLGKLHFSEPVGWMAALLLAFNAFHVRESHFIKVDVPSLFFTIWALHYILYVWKDGSPRFHLLSGVMIGLATATKYNCATLAASYLVAHLFHVSADRQRLRRIVRVVGLPVSGGIMCVVAYAVTNPNWVLDPVGSWRWLRNALGLFDVGNISPPAIPPWQYYARVALPQVLGILLYCVTIAGTLYLLVRRHPAVAILAAYLVPYFAFLFRENTLFFRYILHVLPYAVVISSLAVTDLLTRLRLNRIPVYAAVMAVLLATQVYSVCKTDRLLRRVDTRVIASQWIERNIPANSRILMPYLWGNPFLRSNEELYRQWVAIAPSEQFLHMILRSALLHRLKSYYVMELGDGKVPWTVKDVTIGELQRQRADYLVLHRYPFAFSQPPQDVMDLVGRNYDQIARVSPFVTDSEEGRKIRIEPSDAFYVPLWDFDKVLRPGPEILIYKKR
jgi:hypothetical protein